MNTYEKYKPSGMQWVPNIPAHWSVVSLKWKSRIFSGGTPDKNNDDYWVDGTIPWLNSGSVNQFVIKEPSTFITIDGFRNSSAKWIDENSVVIALAGQGKTKGMSAIVTFRTTCNQSLGVIEPSKDVDSRYLLYFLTHNYRNIRGLAGDGLRDGLNLEMIGSLKVPVFDPAEQAAIADYLDKETTRIDELVERKKRLIELLKEERLAIINHAVTRGLDPTAKLKPSNIEWLGDIPEHWEIKRVKYLITVKSGDGIKSDDIELEGTFPVYGGNGVLGYTESFNGENKQIIIGRVGAKCGNVRLVDGKKWISDNALVASVNDGYDLKYVATLLESLDLNSLAFQNAQPLITGTLVKEKACPVSPRQSEQKQIVKYIETKTQNIDVTISKVEKEIRLLNEYRTALISEVVTGKVKVV